MWVFGYGSLMWNPGFRFLRSEVATMHGVHRALCIYSTHYRGTETAPGLVFGLDSGGSCVGIAFEVDDADREETVAYLRAREQIAMVYREVIRPVRLADGTRVQALTYVADRRHVQYAGRRSADEALAVVTRSAGVAGPNADYIHATVGHLAALGIRDRAVEALAARLPAAS